MALIKNIQDVVKVNDLEAVLFPVPEWYADIMLRPLSGAQRTILTQKVTQRKDGDGIFEWLIIVSAVDEQGNSIFKMEDLAVLKDRNAAVTRKIGEKVLEISGFTPDIVADVESAEKN